MGEFFFCAPYCDFVTEFFLKNGYTVDVKNTDTEKEKAICQYFISIKKISK